MKLTGLLVNRGDSGITFTIAQNYFKSLNWATSYDGIRDALEDMVKINWATAIIGPYNKRQKIFKITEIGRTAYSTTLDLISSKNPLMYLKAFSNIIASPDKT